MGSGTRHFFMLFYSQQETRGQTCLCGDQHFTSKPLLFLLNFWAFLPTYISFSADVGYLIVPLEYMYSSHLRWNSLRKATSQLLYVNITEACKYETQLLNSTHQITRAMRLNSLVIFYSSEKNKQTNKTH